MAFVSINEATKEAIDARVVRAAGRAPWWVIPAVKTALATTDILLAAFCFITAFYLREGGAVVRVYDGVRFAWSAEFLPYAALLLFVVPIRALTFAYYDLYRLRGEFSFVDEVVRIFKATATASLLIVAAAFMYRGVYSFRAFSYARGVFVWDFLLALVSYMSVRFAVRSAQTFARRRDINLLPTLVVGRGSVAALCIKEMNARPELGYRVIGVIDSGEINANMPQQVFEGVPVIGNLESLPDVIREAGASEVIITDTRIPGNTLFEVMMRCGRTRKVEFRVAPSLFNFLPRKTEIDQIGALPMIRLFREPLSNAARITKRLSDIVVSSLALVVFVPLWLIVSALIKLDSKGSVFYLQERVGMDGRVFLFYKFRTMRVDADDAAHREYQRRFIAGSPDANLGGDERPAYKLRSDSRVTRVGSVLRRLSLDELPQLLNVLRGDMSIVGPRPPIPYEVEAYDLWHRKRLDMKPGLTGLWQVSGRNRLSFEEMVRLDLYYIENWSLLLDLKIILRTLPVMLRGDDAY